MMAIQANGQRPYRVIAYATGNADSILKYPVGQLTHIIYSFLKLQNDTVCFHNEWQKQQLQKLVALKKTYPELKIMVSIGGWGGCAPCSALFASAEHRDRFAETAITLFKAYNIDGLDLDWEYPAIEGYPGHRYDTADKTHFTLLVKRIRKEMGSQFLLSFAAGGFIQYLEHSIDWDAVVPEVDLINLMTYDLVGGYSTVTGHHTPLRDYRPGQESTQKCVNWLISHGIPASKLIIGAAFYARVWEQVPDTLHGLYQSGKFQRGVSFKNFDTYFSDSSGFRYYRDREAAAPFRYNKEKRLFATFDDEWSIRKKARFVRHKKLGGIMFWELKDDKPVKGLVENIRKILR